MACLPRSALVAAILLAAVVAGGRCVSGQRNNPLGEVMGVLASEWGNDNLASVTCQEDSLDILLCNNHGQVIAMHLDGVAYDLLTTIPAHIGNLTTLTYLSMVDNSLTGSLPESFSKLVVLQYLDVSNNLISQPLNAIITLASLTYLNMSSNLISAPLPPGMSNLLALDYLDLMSNSLDKVQAVSALTNLKFLRLEECWIEPAPLTIFSPLVALRYLNLFNNSFEGSLAALSTLTRLQHLDLADNYIGPSIPSTVLRLTGLSYLDLSLNNLRGPIDPLTSLTALQDLVLYTNPLSGSFPESISRLSRLTFLEIGATNFTGTLPASLGQMTALKNLGLDRTTIGGSLPASLGNLTRLTAILFDPLSKTLGPRCGKEGACVVNQTAFTAFCNACPDFCLTCSPPGLCTGCKVSEPQPELPAGINSNGSSSSSGSGGLSTGAIIGIVCGVVVLLLALLLAILFFLYRRRKKVSRFGALAKGVCVEYTMKEMAQATNNWMIVVGQVSEMATKHHPNLVRLLGYATCGDLRERIEQILVYEFIPNGDLDKWPGKVSLWATPTLSRCNCAFSTSPHVLPPLPNLFHHFPPQHPQVREKLGQGSLEEIADPRMGPVPPDALQRMADLAVRCCGTFTAERPSMGRIAQEMEALRTEVGGGEEPVHNKSYMKVDAELREKMLYQSQISEDNLNDALASIPSERVAQGTWGVSYEGDRWHETWKK
ncbi:unnamed protein product [Closterium sp. Naga37s-1]|nr:unnamed protein product [Closterium sp. Naga37s-1]